MYLCVLTCEKKIHLILFGLFSPEIHPLILAQVRVIDLSLSSEEIEGLMLTELLQSQCKQLLDQHLQFYNDKQLLADKVVSEEVRNLHSLLLLLTYLFAMGQCWNRPSVLGRAGI